MLTQFRPITCHQLLGQIAIILTGLALAACGGAPSLASTSFPPVPPEGVPGHETAPQPTAASSVPTSFPPGYPGPLPTAFTPAPYPPPTTESGYPGPGAGPAQPLIVHWTVPATEVADISLPMLGLDEFTPPPTPQPFEMRCDSANVVSLRRISDGGEISRLLVEAAVGCPAWQGWSPDGATVALSFNNPEISLWRTDGLPPVTVGAMSQVPDEYFHPQWSPDGLYLAFITDDRWSWPHTATVRIADRAGQSLAEFQIGGGSDGEDLFWLVNGVVCRSDRNSIPCHTASTGQHLFDLLGWHIVTSGSVPPHQWPSLSPDQRWALLDDGDYHIDPGGYRTYHAVYRLFNVVTGRGVTLPDAGTIPLGFAGWSDDGQKAYLLSRPKDAADVPTPEVPFGLLELDVRTRQLTLLFKDAVHVAWSPNRQWALVVFPARAPDGSLGLTAGLWRVGTDTLVGRLTLSKTMIYADLGWYDVISRASPFGMPTWSHNGQRVVLGDAYGGLYMLDVKDVVLPLAQAEISWLDFNTEFAWSPDDQNLLVKHDHRAWIVAAP